MRFQPQTLGVFEFPQSNLSNVYHHSLFLYMFMFVDDIMVMSSVCTAELAVYQSIYSFRELLFVL